MKKILGLILTFQFLLFSLSFGAEGVVQKLFYLGKDAYCLRMTVTTASNGTLTNTLTDYAIDGLLLRVQLKASAGATTPTDSSDISILDGRGEDIMGQALKDWTVASPLSSRPYDTKGSQYIEKPNMGKLTLKLENNSVDSAIFYVYIYFLSNNITIK